MFVVPAPDPSGGAGGCLLVIDPLTGRGLPAAGAEVPVTPYWRRRLACGDVLPVSPAAAFTPAEAGSVSLPGDTFA